MMRSFVLGILLLCFFAPFAQAQYSSTGFERDLVLTLAPAYPNPGQSVQLSIQTSALDLDRALVVWYVNDTEVLRGIGRTETNVSVGGAGSVTTVRVVAQDADGITAATETSIRPTEVDLLWEAASYVPPFYTGRALPGASSPIRAYALARFQKADGTFVPHSNIIYTWYRDNTLVTKGYGKSSATLLGPELFGTAVIRVTAESADKAFRGEASARLTANDPFVSLYENHPLFGILFHRALEGDVNTLETEQKITAVPYFAGVRTPSDPSLQYTWEVDGSAITPNPQEPQTLTVTASGYSGPADISLTITSFSDILLNAVGEARLVFGESTASFFSNLNPFGGAQ